jgi:hypothetical protein
MDLGAIAQQLSNADSSQQAIPPVEKWDPPFCGDMNLVIKKSGQWWHEGTPFTRAKLVKLLASVLKKEDENYYLVTPVEKIGITVEDVPFVIVSWEQRNNVLYAKTQVGDTVEISQEHPVELREFNDTLVPYCLVRSNLWARLHQNVLYQWIELAETSEKNGQQVVHLTSGTYNFEIGTY